MKKKGQFYLVAAVVIVVILFSISTIHNSTKTSDEYSLVYSLADEIKFETSQILDNSALFNVEEQETLSRIQEYLSYISQKNPSTKFLAVYSTEQNIHFITYNNANSDVVGTYENQEVWKPASDSSETIQTLSKNSDSITLEISSETHILNIPEGRQFFVILINERNGERYISIPKNVQ